MRWLIIFFITGCSVNASIGEYQCNEDVSEKRADFVLQCMSPDNNNLNQCVSAATKIFCKDVGF